MTAGSSEAQEQGGGTRMLVELFEVNKSSFEKTKFKNFKKGVDLGLRTAGGGRNGPACGGGGANRATV